MENVFQIVVLRLCLAALAVLLATLALVGLRRVGRLLLRRLKPIALAALLPLAALLTDFAGEKNTNMPLRVIRPVASQAFSSCGAVTNSGWLAHGACDAWFRIPATNWWARTADGWLDGVTVFAWCEFRPDVRTTNAATPSSTANAARQRRRTALWNTLSTIYLILSFVTPT